MLKIFSPKVIQSRVRISDKIASPHKEQLFEARGVMDNYLRDKKCTISISDCPLYDGDYLEVSALNDSKKSLSRISVLKDGDIPFLRKVYQAIEIVTKQSTEKS